MPTVVEIVYEGDERPGLVHTLGEKLNLLLKEMVILENMEKLLSAMIANSVRSFISEGANIFLDRFSASSLGQEFFFIHFSPSSKEAGSLKYSQVAIANGNFLAKELIISPPNKPKYLIEKVAPVIEDIFERCGFQVTRRY